jgi:hypothetical protein
VDVNLNIDEKDLGFVKQYLKGKVRPIDLQDVAYRVALFKTRDSRSHKVKLYNPNCEYKAGDLIYKEYPGKIPIGSKKFIEMEKGVVLNVVGVRTRFGINEVQLKYDGTSEFKKYTDYLERQKIELLLPHKQSRPIEKAEYLSEDEDPRKEQAPLEKRDFSALSRKLAGVLNKDSNIALISDKVLLKENLKSIEKDVFNRIKEFLRENKKSETTEFLVENFVRIRPDDENFDSYCFTLNYKMQFDYKIDFQQTQEKGWGKWNLISVIYYLKKDSPVSDENPLMNKYVVANKKNLVHRRKKFEENLFPDSAVANRYYLTQREITAGAVRLRPGFYDLGETIELEVVDAKQKKSYLVYYYKDVHLMLGFREIFDRYKALQGTILTFELPGGEINDGDGKLHFTIRTTKKGTIVDRVEYVPGEKAFRVTEEKVASPVFVNKSMFLDSVIFKTLYEKLNEFKKAKTLNKLIHKIFLEFGIKERNYEIHILRLYHILDLIYPMDMKVVEEVILGNEEFVPAEKMVGVFYLDSGAVSEIEEEEVKRKETQVDEGKKKRAELRRKKMEQELRVKEEIRQKREERRQRREQEMWEKERVRKELEDKKAQELKKKKERDAQRRAELKAERMKRERERANAAAQMVEPGAPQAARKKVKETTPKSKPHDAEPGITPEEAARRKEAAAKREKKRKDEEKSLVKPHKRMERKPSDDLMSEDDIKSQIELERLKEQMRERKEKETSRQKEKKAKVAYKDQEAGFGGIFASKLDEIVKKEDDKKQTDDKK